MLKTFTIFSEASMYIKSDKIIGNLEGIQINSKKFEGRLSIKNIDGELPDEFSIKIMQVDKKGNSTDLTINNVKLIDDLSLNTLLDFECSEIVETIRGVPKVTKKDEE